MHEQRQYPRDGEAGQDEDRSHDSPRVGLAVPVALLIAVSAALGVALREPGGVPGRLGPAVDLRAGDQLGADGAVPASTSLEADESPLTGESEPVGKQAGDRLLSGSFVVARSGDYQATGVGADAYARKRSAPGPRGHTAHTGTGSSTSVVTAISMSPPVGDPPVDGLRKRPTSSPAAVAARRSTWWRRCGTLDLGRAWCGQKPAMTG